jgi:hypothetical protein
MLDPNWRNPVVSDARKQLPVEPFAFLTTDEWHRSCQIVGNDLVFCEQHFDRGLSNTPLSRKIKDHSNDLFF